MHEHQLQFLPDAKTISKLCWALYLTRLKFRPIFHGPLARVYRKIPALD